MESSDLVPKRGPSKLHKSFTNPYLLLKGAQKNSANELINSVIAKYKIHRRYGRKSV